MPRLRGERGDFGEGGGGGLLVVEDLYNDPAVR